MSIEESRALAERLLDTFNRRDWDAALECFAPDYVNHNPPRVPGVTPDREGQVRGMRTFAELGGARTWIVNLVAEGDRVVVHHVIEATHDRELLGVAATGKDVRVELVAIFRVAGGRFVERWGVIDIAGLRQQLES